MLCARLPRQELRVGTDRRAVLKWEEVDVGGIHADVTHCRTGARAELHNALQLECVLYVAFWLDSRGRFGKVFRENINARLLHNSWQGLNENWLAERLYEIWWRLLCNDLIRLCATLTLKSWSSLLVVELDVCVYIPQYLILAFPPFYCSKWLKSFQKLWLYA